jgi:hypothetical protein
MWFLDGIAEKGGQLLDIYAKDIKEFVNEVQEETVKPLQQIVDIIPIAITLKGEDQQQQQQLSLSSQTPEERLAELHADLKTFTTPIDQEDESVKKWLENFNLESKTEEISRLMKNDTKIAQHHATLVPVEISYEQFWTRYFYRYSLYLEDEERRSKLQQLTKVQEEQAFSWDDDDDDDANIPQRSHTGQNLEQDKQLKEYQILRQVVLNLAETNEQLKLELQNQCPFLFNIVEVKKEEPKVDSTTPSEPAPTTQEESKEDYDEWA